MSKIRNTKSELDLDSLKDQSKEELFEEFLQYVEQKTEINIPLSIFKATSLGPLETLVKYLREELNYTYSKIAAILNRKVGPIGTTYRNAKSKHPSRLKIVSTFSTIPVSIFKKSKNSILETIVHHLKDNESLTYTEIASLLNRNYRTIWTVYKRATKK
jgi:hypothetical protein|tara:strand:+ start:280 stop:756 length:477 start_codon:yes stop_codon:yes gene_type:complete